MFCFQISKLRAHDQHALQFITQKDTSEMLWLKQISVPHCPYTYPKNAEYL